MAIITGTDASETMTGTIDDDILTGGRGNDIINGLDGDDRILWVERNFLTRDFDGNDVINGGSGTDTLSVTEQLVTGNTALQVQMGDHNSVLVLRGRGVGGNPTQLIATLNSVERLELVASGSAGSFVDIFLGDLTGSALTGPITINARGVGAMSLTLNQVAHPFRNDLIVLGSDSGDYLADGAGNDQLYGYDGNDVLFGSGGGSDTLVGGRGDDFYDLRDFNDSYVELVNEGIDTINAGARSYQLGLDVENLMIDSVFQRDHFLAIGNASDNRITTGEGDDTLVGLEGNDTLVGATRGADTMQGGAGNDTYYVFNHQDILVELAGEGDDTVRAFVSDWTLTAEFENLEFANATDNVGVGNAAANIMTGEAGRDTLYGLEGDDTLAGRGGSDTLVGGSGIDVADYSLAATGVTARLDIGAASNDGDGGSDTLSGIENLAGSAFDDLLFGSGASNELWGGQGRDVLLGLGGDDIIHGGAGVPNELYGGLGDDVYVVESRSDTIVEKSGEGTDTVVSAIFQINLSANVENLTYTGTGTFTGVGNAIGNTIRGGTQRDVLLGGGGDDILIGGAGTANELYGQAGNDTFILDMGDTVIENLGEGIDTVEARIGSYTLGANIENLLYTGTGSFVGNGNALDNIIVGGNQNDILRGEGGNDTISGGGGNLDEVQFVGTKAQYTVTVEGSGYRIVDTVAARDGSTFVTSVESLRFLTDNTTTLLVYPPVAPGALEPVDKAGGEDFGGRQVSTLMQDPEVLPGSGDDFIMPDKATEMPLVLPSAFDDDLFLVRPALGENGLRALMHLQIDGENNTLFVDGPNGLHVLHDTVGDYDGFGRFYNWG